MIVRSRDFMTEPPSGKLLAGVINEHRQDAERMARLRAAYENRRDILTRERVKGLPNNRLAHGFARYISTMASGYLIGNPVQYSAKKQNAAMDAVNDVYSRTDVQSVDAELARDASVFGRGVELLFSDDQARPRTSSLPPESAFVVYDDTVENMPLFGVYFAPRTGEDGRALGWTVTACTDKAIYAYRVANPPDVADATPISIVPNFFQGVPMVEYWNNEDETGDFEQVNTLIDAYDALESDRVNDKEQFVDALLVLTGVMMEKDENGRTPGQQLRQDKVLSLPDKDASAEYLARSLTEADVEVLKDALKADIHKFSMVPDLTDQAFAGNVSGVAMKYKLLGLEQLTKIKERWFKEALKTRLRMFAAFMQVKGAPALDADDVEITFTRSLPTNELETAQTVRTLQGIVPNELLLSQIPFVDDVQGAIQSLEKEKEADMKRQREQLDGFNDVKNEEKDE